MAAMKTMMIFVVDAGLSMGEKVDSTVEASPTKLSLALGIVSSHICQRIMASKTVQFGVVAFGVDVTHNYLNNASSDQYLNVQEVLELDTQKVLNLKSLLDIKVGSQDGDMIDGIVVGQDIFSRNSKGKFNRIMVLLTDGEQRLNGTDEIEFIAEILSTMKDKECSFHAIQIGKGTSENFHIRNENSKLLRSMAEQTGGKYTTAVSLGDVVEFMSCSPGFGTRPQTRKIEFELSPECKIQCVQWGKVSTIKIPSLKKRLISANPTDPESGNILQDRSLRNPADPDEILGFEDKVKGFKYGHQYIPINSADESAMKLPPSDPVIRLLGFLPIHRIPRHHFLEGPVVIMGDGDRHSMALSALSTALQQQKQAALVRFVKTRDGDPRLAVLLPPSTNEHGLLLLHRLPCAEDIRLYDFPSLWDPRLGPADTSSQRTSISQLVDVMTVTTADHSKASKDSKKTTSDDCSENMTQSTKLTTFNPAYCAVFGELQRRGLYDDSDAVCTRCATPFDFLGDAPAAASAVSAVLSGFPLKPVSVDAGEQESGKRKKSYWSDIYLHEPLPSAAMGDDGMDEPPPPEIEMEETPLSVLHLGTVTPVEDFLTLLEVTRGMPRGAEVVAEAMNTLSQIVELLVTNGGTAAHYRKAVHCLQTLRSAAVGEGEHDRFNSFMRTVVKGELSTGRHSAFWMEVVKARITLVSTAEDSGSSVSPDAAEAFLKDSEETIPLSVTQSVCVDEDDMFGSME